MDVIPTHTHTHTKYIESLKTTIAPEKNWLEDEISLFKIVPFWGVILHIITFKIYSSNSPYITTNPD